MASVADIVRSAPGQPNKELRLTKPSILGLRSLSLGCADRGKAWTADSRMKRTIASQLRDLAIYVGVGVAMLVGVWALVAYDTSRGTPSNPARVNWLILGLVTGIVYINAIHEGRRFRRRPRFWAGLGIALLVQVVGSVVALWNAPKIPVFIWTIAVMANMAVVGGFMHWWLTIGIKGHRLTGGPRKG
jgi:hypothetical protein